PVPKFMCNGESLTSAISRAPNCSYGAVSEANECGFATTESLINNLKLRVKGNCLDVYLCRTRNSEFGNKCFRSVTRCKRSHWSSAPSKLSKDLIRQYRRITSS